MGVPVTRGLQESAQLLSLRRPMSPTVDKPQTGMDERVVDDPDLERKLSTRQAAKDRLSDVALDFKAADEAARGAVAALELGDGDIVRIGRFRISKTRLAGGHVEFEKEPKDVTRIGLAKE